MTNQPQAQGQPLERRLQTDLRTLIQTKKNLGYEIISRSPLTLLRGTGPKAPGFRLESGLLKEIRGIDIYPIF